MSAHESGEGYDGEVTVAADGVRPRTALAAPRRPRPDVWGNTRLTGVGRPPFPVELLDGAAG